MSERLDHRLGFSMVEVMVAMSVFSILTVLMLKHQWQIIQRYHRIHQHIITTYQVENDMEQCLAMNLPERYDSCQQASAEMQL